MPRRNGVSEQIAAKNQQRKEREERRQRATASPVPVPAGRDIARALAEWFLETNPEALHDIVRRQYGINLAGGNATAFTRRMTSPAGRSASLRSISHSSLVAPTISPLSVAVGSLTGSPARSVHDQNAAIQTSPIQNALTHVNYQNVSTQLPAANGLPAAPMQSGLIQTLTNPNALIGTGPSTQTNDAQIVENLPANNSRQLSAEVEEEEEEVSDDDVIFIEPYPASEEKLIDSMREPVKRGEWKLFEQDIAIAHMLNVRDEGVIKGEARFKEVVRRMQELNQIVRTWIGMKNFWNRIGRARSGFDERKVRTAPLATSKQGKKARQPKVANKAAKPTVSGSISVVNQQSNSQNNATKYEQGGKNLDARFADDSHDASWHASGEEITTSVERPNTTRDEKEHSVRAEGEYQTQVKQEVDDGAEQNFNSDTKKELSSLLHHDFNYNADQDFNSHVEQDVKNADVKQEFDDNVIPQSNTRVQSQIQVFADLPEESAAFEKCVRDAFAQQITLCYEEPPFEVLNHPSSVEGYHGDINEFVIKSIEPESDKKFNVKSQSPESNRSESFSDDDYEEFHDPRPAFPTSKRMMQPAPKPAPQPVLSGGTKRSSSSSDYDNDEDFQDSRPVKVARKDMSSASQGTLPAKKSSQGQMVPPPFVPTRRQHASKNVPKSAISGSSSESSSKPRKTAGRSTGSGSLWSKRSLAALPQYPNSILNPRASVSSITQSNKYGHATHLNSYLPPSVTYPQVDSSTVQAPGTATTDEDFAWVERGHVYNQNFHARNPSATIPGSYHYINTSGYSENRLPASREPLPSKYSASGSIIPHPQSQARSNNQILGVAPSSNNDFQDPTTGYGSVHTANHFPINLLNTPAPGHLLNPPAARYRSPVEYSEEDSDLAEGEDSKDKSWHPKDWEKW